MLRRHLQKIGSILGLLAILMATLAPTVSQALSAQERLDAALVDHCSAQTDALASSGTHDSLDSHSLAFHWEACGYCGLLAHFPVVPPVPLAFATQAAFTHTVVVHTSVSAPSVTPHFYAQPRAPPAAVL
ncbi:DUF2946 domain-containing protein [Paraburkholderia fungorum]|uniref:DUF2946 domain-containing protein n=1 Tax=Paraburkholderia fungorum TaxID=134537 RepID=UPI0038BADFF4